MPIVQTDIDSPAGQILNQMGKVVEASYNESLRRFEVVMRAFWLSPDPQAILDLMGAGAKVNFEASACEAAKLAEQSPRLFKPAVHARNMQRLATILSLQKPYTEHEDGTVTIDSTPA